MVQAEALYPRCFEPGGGVIIFESLHSYKKEGSPMLVQDVDKIPERSSWTDTATTRSGTSSGSSEKCGICYSRIKGRKPPDMRWSGRIDGNERYAVWPGR